MTPVIGVALITLGVMVGITTPPLSGGTLLAVALITLGAWPVVDRVQAVAVNDDLEEDDL